MSTKTRIEKDLLGELAVPADAYYGVQTARALENFQISGVNTNHYPGFFEAWAIVKLAAARANTDVGAMKKEKLALIDRAIGEAERALAADPADGYLSGHLTRTRMRKLDLLRRAAVLAHAES